MEKLNSTEMTSTRVSVDGEQWNRRMATERVDELDEDCETMNSS